MPKMDGITLTKEIMKRNPEFPIMIMTAFAKDSYMGRPVNEEAILARSHRFFGKAFFDRSSKGDYPMLVIAGGIRNWKIYRRS
jgi:CheY-like chemotaxis protein